MSHYSDRYSHNDGSNHSYINGHMCFTSNLRAACKTDRYRWSRGVGGGVLGLSHPIGLVDPLAPAELPVLRRAGAEPWRLIVTSLKERRRDVIPAIQPPAQHLVNKA